MAQIESVSPKHEAVTDVTVEQVARVYARAFMGVAASAPDAEDLVQELKSLIADVLDRFPQFERTLASSLISAEEKEQMLDRIFAKPATVQVLNFLKVLARHGRLELLRPVVRQVEKLQTERSGKTNVEVRVAAKLDDDLRNEIFLRLQRALGTLPILEERIDPSLIAGIVVRVGDQVFDGSLRTRLEQARQAMIERATEQIEIQPDRFFAAD